MGNKNKRLERVEEGSDEVDEKSLSKKRLSMKSCLLMLFVDHKNLYTTNF